MGMNIGGPPVTPRNSEKWRFLAVPIAAEPLRPSQCHHDGCTRTVLPHAPVLVQASARKARANGRGRGLGGPPQERLPLHGRRGPTRPSILWLGRAAFDAVMPCRLWLLGWRDADASLCSGLLAAMPRCLCLRLERNSAGRCHGCGPGCRRHRLSRGMW